MRNARLYADATALYEAGEDRNAELQTMLGAAEALSSTVDFQLVLQAVCWRIKEDFAAAPVSRSTNTTPRPTRLVYREHAADEEYWVEDPDWTGRLRDRRQRSLERCVYGRETIVVVRRADETPTCRRRGPT